MADDCSISLNIDSFSLFCSQRLENNFVIPTAPPPKIQQNSHNSSSRGSLNSSNPDLSRGKTPSSNPGSRRGSLDRFVIIDASCYSVGKKTCGIGFEIFHYTVEHLFNTLFSQNVIDIILIGYHIIFFLGTFMPVESVESVHNQMTLIVNQSYILEKE